MKSYGKDCNSDFEISTEMQFLVLPSDPNIQISNENALTVLTDISHYVSRKPRTNTNFADLTSLKSVQKCL